MVIVLCSFCGTMGMGFQKSLPAGTYYLGDPSHILSAGRYKQLNEQMFKRRVSVKAEGYFPIQDHDVGVTLASTVDGGGSFDDSDGHCYNVDAGMIGLTPEAIVEPDRRKARKKKRPGRWETFKKPIVVKVSKTKLDIVSGRVVTISLQQQKNPSK